MQWVRLLLRHRLDISNRGQPHRHQRVCEPRQSTIVCCVLLMYIFNQHCFACEISITYLSFVFDFWNGTSHQTGENGLQSGFETPSII